MTKLALMLLLGLRCLRAEDVEAALPSCMAEDEECSVKLLQRGALAKQKLATADPSCSAAPECAKLKLQGNCCPNDAGVSLGCCPGGGSVVPAPEVASVAKDSKRLCENNPACAELNLKGLCCPNPAGAALGCCDSEIEKQDMLGAGPAPELAPPALEPGPLMTFYLYRVDNDQRYKLNGVNMANLLGDVWYLHNEVVFNCPRKFNISRLTRFKVSYRATRELRGQEKNFDHFVAFDKAKCTVPGCSQLHWDPLGYVLGCTKNDPGRVALPGEAAWYSLPGTCPSKFYFQKSASCIQNEPGGQCKGKEVTGARDCTYTIEEAGEIPLYDLSGIKNYNDVCESTGVREYDETTDKGVGTSFWNGAWAQKGGPQEGQAPCEAYHEALCQALPPVPCGVAGPHL